MHGPSAAVFRELGGGSRIVVQCACGEHARISHGVCPGCGAVLVAPEPRRERWEVGDCIEDRYTLEYHLGDGALASVFMALDRESGQRVAIKLLKRPIRLFHSEENARLEAEMRLSQSINHPNVVQMYRTGQHQGHYFMAMECVDGETLRDYMLRKWPLSLEAIAGILEGVCSGLQAAHDVGVIHRDLKTENILIDQDGQVHLLDFGLARHIADPRITRTGIAMGTPLYMAPEVIRGAKVLDHRVDVYAAGILAFEMLVGRTPFHDGDVKTVLNRQVQTLPKPPSSFRAGIPEEVDLIVLRCLAKNPSHRPSSVLELAREFRRVLDERQGDQRGQGVLLVVEEDAVRERCQHFFRERGQQVYLGAPEELKMWFENKGLRLVVLDRRVGEGLDVRASGLDGVPVALLCDQELHGRELDRYFELGFAAVLSPPLAEEDLEALALAWLDGEVETSREQLELEGPMPGPPLSEDRIDTRKIAV